MAKLRLDRAYHLRAPAKINLGLEVIGRRSDGYHEIVTILQTINLCDDIEFRPASKFAYTSDARIPPHDDLILRAVNLVRERFGISLCAELRVQKNIPISAGLGGGSSDAGAVLSLVGELAYLPPIELRAIAAELGSDVPFFLRGGCALATGTGTELEALPDPPMLSLVLIVPDVSILAKTRSLYARLSADDFSDGRDTFHLAEQLRNGLPISPLKLRNTFERALKEFAPIRSAYDELIQAGATIVLPSGAGPSLIGLFPTLELAEKALTDWPSDRRFLPRFVAAPRSPA